MATKQFANRSKARARPDLARRRAWPVDKIGIGVAAVFAALVALGGGSARHDIASLIYLRPVAFLAIMWAVLTMMPDAWRRLPFPFYVLLGLAIACLLQLVPLPPSMWVRLPHRDVVHDIDAMVGLQDLWRSISLVPGRTWNAFFALGVPVATFLLLAGRVEQLRARVLQAVVAIGMVSMALGFLQVIGGEGSAFYTYGVHTEGQPVGLFANRNHQGAFLAIVIVICAILIARINDNERSAGLRATIYGGVIVLIVPFVLVLGSRAGLLLSLIALVAAQFIALRSPWIEQQAARFRKRAGAGWRAGRLRVLQLAGVVLALALAALLAYLNADNEALDRLAAGGEESAFSRSAVFPTLLRMAQDFFPWGSGFGSFDSVFGFYETRAVLSPFYLNQAHNDWLQPIIEGGVLSLVVMMLFFAWLANTTLRALRGDDPRMRTEQLGLLLCLVLAGAASLVDYPVRVPIFMMVLAAVCALLSETTPQTGQTRKGAAA